MLFRYFQHCVFFALEMSHFSYQLYFFLFKPVNIIVSNQKPNIVKFKALSKNTT